MFEITIIYKESTFVDEFTSESIEDAISLLVSYALSGKLSIKQVVSISIDEEKRNK